MLKESYREIISYSIWGIMTTIVNILIYKTLINLNIHYTISTSIAWLISVIFAFFTNKIFVFRSKLYSFKYVIVEMLKFFAARFLTYFIDLFGLVYLINNLKVNSLTSKVIVNMLIIIINYILSKKMIFNKIL
jgi:putative flippase GtrA